MRVKLKNGNVGELIAVGIEELVVINIRVLAENPFSVRSQIGLRRPAFDLVAQRVLPFVGVRQVELIEEEKAACEQYTNHHYRKHNAINADAGGLDRRHFIGAFHQSKRDQDRQQHSVLRQVVDEVRAHVQQVVAHDPG